MKFVKSIMDKAIKKVIIFLFNSSICNAVGWMNEWTIHLFELSIWCNFFDLSIKYMRKRKKKKKKLRNRIPIRIRNRWEGILRKKKIVLYDLWFNEIIFYKIYNSIMLSKTVAILEFFAFCYKYFCIILMAWKNSVNWYSTIMIIFNLCK